MGLWERLKDAVRGADAADGLDRPTLRRRVVDGILELRHRGGRGVDQLPSAVSVRVVVDGVRVETVTRSIDDPAFDEDVEADLLNRLTGVDTESLPLRLYEVTAGDEPGVEVACAPGEATWAWLRIEGGDRDEAVVPLPAARKRFHLGRGPWHGRDDTLPNDVVVSESDAFVSRRAAILERAGSGYELQALDQRDHLAVVRGSGRRVRPFRVRRGRVRVRRGDQIELDNGGDDRGADRARAVVRLHVLGAPPVPPPPAPEETVPEPEPGGTP